MLGVLLAEAADEFENLGLIERDGRAAVVDCTCWENQSEPFADVVTGEADWV